MKKDTPKGLYHVPGYISHSDCNDREIRGGAMIFSKAELQVEQCDQLMQIGMKDAIWVKLKIPDCRREVTIGAIYRKGTRGRNQDENLLKCLDKVNPATEVLICGDFNLPKIDWENGVVMDSQESPTQRIFDKLDDQGLTQVVRQTTRRRGRDEPSLLDWIVVSRAENVDEVEHLAPLGAGDHDVLYFTYRINIRVPIRTKRQIFDFRRTDFNELRGVLGYEQWNGVYNTNVVND